MIKIRLYRHGRKKLPFYSIIVIDKRNTKNNKFIEKLGFYNPLTNKDELKIKVNYNRILFWISNGAKLSETVDNLLKKYKYILHKNKDKDKDEDEDEDYYYDYDNESFCYNNIT